MLRLWLSVSKKHVRVGMGIQRWMVPQGIFTNKTRGADNWKIKEKKKRVTGTNSEGRDILLTWFGRGCPVSGNGPCKKLLMSDLFYPMMKDFCKGGSGIFLHDNSFAHEGIMGQSLMGQSH